MQSSDEKLIENNSQDINTTEHIEPYRAEYIALVKFLVFSGGGAGYYGAYNALIGIMVMQDVKKRYRAEYIERYRADWQEEPVTSLVFSGGGAKGAGYYGVYNALIDAMVMQDVKKVVGSSAGAVTAALIATAIQQSDYQDICQSKNFKDLLGEKDSEIPKNSPVENFSTMGMLGKTLYSLKGNTDGKPLFELVDNAIRESIRNVFLEPKPNPELDEINEPKLPKLNEKLKAETDLQKRQDIITEYIGAKDLEKQKDIAENKHQVNKRTEDQEKRLNDLMYKSIDPYKKITFGDLAFLNTILPSKFKNLAVTAITAPFDKEKEAELVVFDTQNPQYANVAIVDAVSASTRIPPALAPHKIEYVDHKGAHHSEYYQDGGILNNIAISEKEATGNTLVFAFSSENEKINKEALKYTEKYMSKRAKDLSKDVNNWIATSVITNKTRVKGPKFEEANIKTIKELQENSVRVIILDTEDVDTFSFKKATAKAKYLGSKAYVETTNHLANWMIGSINIYKLQYINLAIELYRKNNNAEDQGSISIETFFKDIQEAKDLKALQDVVKNFIIKANNPKIWRCIGEILNDPRRGKILNKVRKDFINCLKKDPSNESSSQVLKYVGDKYKITISDIESIVKIIKSEGFEIANSNQAQLDQKQEMDMRR